jgi:integrase
MQAYRKTHDHPAERPLRPLGGGRAWARQGITTYLQNGGKLEIAQQMAGHESARTTGLYDRRNDAVELDEVERVVY